MKGLILKDLINLKKQGKFIGIFIIFFSFLSLAGGSSANFGAITTMLCVMLPITAMTYDEKAKWDKYALTMPVSRKDMVISKYLLGLLFVGAAFAIYIAFNFFASSHSMKEPLLISLVLLAVGITFMSIIFPILFKYGVEKGRLLMMLVLFVPTGLIVLLSKTGFQLPSEDTLHALSYASPVIVIAIFVVSVAVSLKIYAEKEM